VRSSYPHHKTNGILNLSTHVLSSFETQALELGHSFILKPPHMKNEKITAQLRKIISHKPTLHEVANEISRVPVDQNLNNELRRAIRELCNNQNIVITVADKGDTWVILNKEDYIFECHRQLSDKQFYAPLLSSQRSVNSKLYRNVLLRMLREKRISKYKFENLVPKDNEVKDRIFYILPKIHKSKATWSNNGKIPPGRPIVGNCQSEDTAISQYVDSFLRPIVMKRPYILSNSEQFLAILEKLTLQNHSILFSLDVSSLYTNIPIDKGLETVRRFFNQYPDKTRPNEYILELLKISLYKNEFLFNGQWFKQTKGVAMGKSYAPNFANLYMSEWEGHILTKLPGPKPKLWLRYLDDIFGIWESSLADLQMFVELINEFDKNIQVTYNCSFSDLQYLDLVVFKNAELQISTMVYLKPTSSLKMLHPESLHPRHMKEGVILSQILRYVKNCNFHSDFMVQFSSLQKALVSQGYTRSCIRQIKSRALALLNYQHTPEGEIMKGFHPCTSDCLVCLNHGITKTSLEFNTGAKMISQFLTCSTSNVIYIICCVKCPQMYVGESKNSLKKRITQHLSSIRHKKDNSVSLHFTSENHSIADLKFFALMNNEKWTTIKRRKIETGWIKRLNTLKPNGMNLDINDEKTTFVTIPFKGCHSVPQNLFKFLDDSHGVCYTTGSPLRILLNHKHKIARSKDSDR
jgi:hypothetical protein